MADLKQNVKEEKDTDSENDSPDITQESLRNQTCSPKNNASSLLVQLSSDSHEKPLNGAQPTPFVRSSVPAVSAAADALPTGALVNGPGSHPTSDELGVLNKGGVSLSGALHAEQAGKASSPGVSRPTGELEPDARRNVAGTVPKTPPAEAGEEAARLNADDSESEERGSGLSREDRDKMEAIQTRTGEAKGDQSMWNFDTESSESSSDDYDLNWDPQKEFMQFLWNDCRKEEGTEMEATPPSIGQRRRRRKMDAVVGLSENVYTGLSLTSKRSLMDGSSDCESPIPNNRVRSFRKRSGLQSSMDSCEKYSSDTVVAIKQLILSAPAKKHPNGSVAEVDGHALAEGKTRQLKAEPAAGFGSEQEPSFFPCTKCNVNFKEKKHLHRHMMYHLDGHNQVRHLNVPRPFICRECGRSFRDRNSLLKHMIIHQERRERLMEEIKGLSELQDEGRGARLQCPQCVFGTNCPKTFVQHAKTHEKDKRYYCCEECDHMAVTERELEAHLHAAHCGERKSRYATLANSDGPREQTKRKKNNVSMSASFPCEMCPFSTQNKNVMKKHVELIHQQPYRDDNESLSYGDANDYAAPVFERRKFSGKSRKADSQRCQPKPKFCIERQAFRKRAELPFWSDGIADLFIKSKSTQKARKGFSSSLSKWSLGNSTNKLSPSLRRTDKPSKLSLQLAEKIDVTTGLPYDEGNKDDRGYGSTFSGNVDKPKSFLSYYEPLASKMGSSCMYYPSYDSDNGQGDSEDSDSRPLTVHSGTKKSPSKRKMSTPYHNTMDKATHMIIPNHEQTPKRQEDRYEDTYDFSDYTSEATANFLDCSENEQNPYARSYFIRRQRFPIKGDRGPSGDPFEKPCPEKDSDEIQKLVVKEECVESEVTAEPQESGVPSQADLSDFDASHFGAERKSCPYCPAEFESGVGLSNHVRGHLHRVGLSYDARHVVSPEQVASQDRRPRVRRKVPPMSRRVKKADKPESQAEHTCPLCGGWFDTKTGLSNHVRGHLKRIGKTISSKSKSPVCILNEMMQDEEEYQNILQVLNKKRFLSRPFVSQKFASSDGLFLTPTGIPVKIQHASQDGRLWGLSTSQQEEEGPEKRQAETKHGMKPPSSALIELLKKKKMDEDLGLKNCSPVAKKRFDASPPKEGGTGPQLMRMQPSWMQEKSEINKKVCVHCNTTFPSAVSLSNHLRAYARRKRVALLEGTSYDCKQKKQRSRPGPKKKVFPLPHAADEIYRLTCRFCDLVFQGPLSVQEDWIKHLQRHIMNTSVPRTGAGMVEVTSLPKEPPSTPEEPTPLLVPQAAS